MRGIIIVLMAILGVIFPKFLVKAIKSTDKNDAGGGLLGSQITFGMLMLIIGIFLNSCIQVISNQYAERLLSEAEKTETYRGLSKIDILHTVSIPQLARTIPLKGLNLSLEKYRMPDGVIIEVESSSHYLGSFSEKNDSSTNWIEKIMEGVGIH